MRLFDSLTKAFGPEPEFETLLASFATSEGLLPEAASLKSRRYLTRSIAPHVERLSQLFNRESQSQDKSLEPYWKLGSNREHLRLAYFLYFMPPNLFRIASIWSELSKLGFQWKSGTLKGIEFGSGPATGACGIAAGEHFSDGVGLPPRGSWALIEQDKPMLELGCRWAGTYFSHLGFGDWDVLKFPRKIDPTKQFLPSNAPRFNLWLMSYFLNELEIPPKDLALSLIKSWDRHLEEEGVIILSEPALKLQSRKLLELRKELLAQSKNLGINWLKILLPCLGHQACGALANPEDWCHEEVSWWRPPYYRTLDDVVGLDHKTLPFSYLVIVKTTRTLEEILPKLAANKDAASKRYRLVSPAYKQGRDMEFFLCGQDGKKRARILSGMETETESPSNLQRGDILEGAELRGDPNLSRVDRLKKIT